MVTINISLTQLRPQFPKILDRIAKYLDRCIVTRHGKAEAVILSETDYENLLETLEILSNQKLVSDIKRGQEDLRVGKSISWDVVKNKLGYE